MSERQQPWADDVPEHGRILVLSDNPISRAIETIATAVGRQVHIEAVDDGGPGLQPGPGDAVVLCDHDAPDAPRVLRAPTERWGVAAAVVSSNAEANVRRILGPGCALLVGCYECGA